MFSRKMIGIVIIILAIIITVSVIVFYGQSLLNSNQELGHATPTPTAAPSMTPTSTPAATPTINPTQKATATPIPSSNPTSNPTPSPTIIPTPTSTATSTPSPSPTSTPTSSPTLTPTPSPTSTTSRTPTPSPTPQVTPVPTASGTIGYAVTVPNLPASQQPYSNGLYHILAWNDLGMHCYNPGFKDVGVLPPYNNLWAQVIRMGGESPQIVTTGITVSYYFINNTYSVGKTDFWTYASALFNVTLQPNVGLTGKGLSGTLDLAPPPGSVNGRPNHFEANGIPLTEYFDSDVTSGPSSTWTRHPYQLAVISVTDSTTGALLARTVVTAPVSTEMTCDSCHRDTGIATTKYPITRTNNTFTNILTLHDYLHSQTPSLMNSRPVLCAKCHGSNALGLSGTPGIPNLSNAMHTNHATVTQITPDTNGCYSCHPGPTTKCLRDVMSQQFNMTCISCHGNLAQVGTNANPWLNEPRCDSPGCHSNVVTQNDALFRHATAMHGIYCEACHGSTHGILPSTQVNDAIQSMYLQGITGPMYNCSICHGNAVGLGGDPHYADYITLPLLFLVIPFLVAIPAVAFIARSKKLWKGHYFSVLRIRKNRTTT